MEGAVWCGLFLLSQVTQELLQELLVREHQRLSVWALPLVTPPAPVPVVPAGRWRSYVRVAWRVDPHVALALPVRRFEPSYHSSPLLSSAVKVPPCAHVQGTPDKHTFGHQPNP